MTILLHGAKPSEEKLYHSVHFDGVVAESSKSDKHFYIESSPVCNIVALKRAILKF
jgi:hypothetical protein